MSKDSINTFDVWNGPNSEFVYQNGWGKGYQKPIDKTFGYTDEVERESYRCRQNS